MMQGPSYPTPVPGSVPSNEPVPARPMPAPLPHKSSSKAWLWVLLSLVVLGGAGVLVAWKVFDVFGSEENGNGNGGVTTHVPVAADAAQVASIEDAASPSPGDATRAAATPGDATTTTTDDAAQVASIADAAEQTPSDAGMVASATDAGTPVPADAGTPGPAVGELVIASTPAGARVFLGGADQGVTPVKLPGTADRHTIALVLAGHELYVAQVDGHGSFTIPLPEITPSSGPAGIKVLKCAKDRYYVFVDGKPTGQMCPTERIGCETGPHTVEVYDVVSETRRKWEIDVKDTRLSYRVRVDAN
jgi:hypothetical protein